MRAKESERESIDEGQLMRIDDDEESERGSWGRRRLLQVLGGAAGLATIGISENGPAKTAHAQANESGIPEDEPGQIVRINQDDDVYQVGRLLSAPSTFAPGDSIQVEVEVEAVVDQANDNVVYGAVGSTSGDVYGLTKMPGGGSGTVIVNASIPTNATGKVYWTWVPAIDDTEAQTKAETSLSGGQIGSPSDGRVRDQLGTLGGDGANWIQQQKLTANDGDSDDAFGESVSVSDDGTTALIGAFEDEDPNGDKAGSAYVFVKSGGSWNQQQKLSASDGNIDDGFGVSTSLSDDGTTALVGAADVDEFNADDINGPGSAYVFTESGGSWSQQQKLTANDPDTADVFGGAVSLSDDGTTALIGASGNKSAYIFTKSDQSWSQQQKLTASDGGGGILGVSISLSDDGTTALIGDSGSAYVFTESDGSWSQQQKLTPADSDPLAFGESVSISDDGATALIGALRDSEPNGSGAGSVYVFTESDGSWSQQQKLSANDGDSDDQFGRSVSVASNGTTAFIGADSDEDPNGDRAGSAYIFMESGGSWSQQQKLSANNGDSTDFFGRAVSVVDDGTTVLIGTPFDETSTSSLTGSAYVFTSNDGDDSAVYDPGSVAGEYDSDGDGQITASELGDAVTDFGQDDLTASELGEVVTAFGQS